MHKVLSLKTVRRAVVLLMITAIFASVFAAISYKSEKELSSVTILVWYIIFKGEKYDKQRVFTLCR